MMVVRAAVLEALMMLVIWTAWIGSNTIGGQRMEDVFRFEMIVFMLFRLTDCRL